MQSLGARPQRLSRLSFDGGRLSGLLGAIRPAALRGHDITLRQCHATSEHPITSQSLLGGVGGLLRGDDFARRGCKWATSEVNRGVGRRETDLFSTIKASNSPKPAKKGHHLSNKNNAQLEPAKRAWSKKVNSTSVPLWNMYYDSPFSGQLDSPEETKDMRNSVKGACEPIGGYIAGFPNIKWHLFLTLIGGL